MASPAAGRRRRPRPGGRDGGPVQPGVPTDAAGLVRPPAAERPGHRPDRRAGERGPAAGELERGAPRGGGMTPGPIQAVRRRTGPSGRSPGRGSTRKPPGSWAGCGSTPCRRTEATRPSKTAFGRRLPSAPRCSQCFCRPRLQPLSHNFTERGEITQIQGVSCNPLSFTQERRCDTKPLNSPPFRGVFAERVRWLANEVVVGSSPITRS